MISVAEAQDLVLVRCERLPARPVALGVAADLVLADALTADAPVPPFDNSAMDGYALRAADLAGRPCTRLRVVGSLMAGGSPTVAVRAGEAVRIMTGAPIPDGADAVCVVERTRREDGAVVVEGSVEPGANIRRAGEDIALGARVFGAGTCLTPAHVGVLASLGIRSLRVHPRPVVGVLSTGDELSTADGPLGPGRIRDANRPALLAQLRGDGFDAVDLGLVADDEEALAALLERAAADCDAVVASGGVSVGDRDVVRTVLATACRGDSHALQIAVKPAKPFAFGILGSSATPVFGLPGNPVSALVSYELFVRPALRSMAGHALVHRPRMAARAEVDLRRHRDGKLHVLRVHAACDGHGMLRVRPSGIQESHMLTGMAGANALALLPDGEGIPAGEQVEVLVVDADRVGRATPEAL